MTSSSTLAADTAPAPPPVPPAIGLPHLRIALIVIAGLEVLDGLSIASTLFDGTPGIPGSGIGGAMVGAGIATHPVLALAALLFAALGRVRSAIIVLGAVVFVTWLKYMPTAVQTGMDFSGVGAIWTPAQIIVFPLLAVCAIGYAARNERLVLATALAAIPTLFNVAAVFAVALAITIRGF